MLQEGATIASKLKSRGLSLKQQSHTSPDMTREQKVQAFATAITNDVMSALEHLKESFARGTSLYPDFQTEFPKALDKISDTGAVRKTSDFRASCGSNIEWSQHYGQRNQCSKDNKLYCKGWKSNTDCQRRAHW